MFRASNNEKDEKIINVRYNVKRGIPQIYLRDRREMFFLHLAIFARSWVPKF